MATTPVIDPTMGPAQFPHPSSAIYIRDGEEVIVPFSEEEVACIRNAVENQSQIGPLSGRVSGYIRETYLRKRLPWMYSLKDRTESIEMMCDSLTEWYMINEFLLDEITPEENIILNNSVRAMVSSLVPSIVSINDFVIQLVDKLRTVSDIGDGTGRTNVAKIRLLASIKSRCENIIETCDNDSIDYVVATAILDQLEESFMRPEWIEERIWNTYWQRGVVLQIEKTTTKMDLTS